MAAELTPRRIGRFWNIFAGAGRAEEAAIEWKTFVLGSGMVALLLCVDGVRAGKRRSMTPVVKETARCEYKVESRGWESMFAKPRRLIW